jgi:O-methyltransferase
MSAHDDDPRSAPDAGRPRAASADQASEPSRRIGISFRKSYARRVNDGFIARYLSGANILDIGFRGGDPEAVPITETAIGIELDYPGYDGTHLPFPDESQDAVLAAHVLEHIPNYREVLPEWYRVLRIGGYIVIMVPHRYLYERRCDLPSRWNGDHKRFYTPASLLAEIEASLPVNGFRLRHMIDNDEGFNYQAPVDAIPSGNYEIELVLERIMPPAWAGRLIYPEAVQRTIAQIDSIVFLAVAATLRDAVGGPRQFFEFVNTLRYFTPWVRLRQRFVVDGAPELDGARATDAALRAAVRPLLDCLTVDEAVYGRHGDLRTAVEKGALPDLTAHWRNAGYFEGRISHEYDLAPMHPANASTRRDNASAASGNDAAPPSWQSARNQAKDVAMIQATLGSSAVSSGSAGGRPGEIERVRAQIQAAHREIRSSATYSPWFRDPAFWAVYQAIQGYSLVDLTRCYELWSLVAEAAKTDGDIIEVGVWRGGTGCLLGTRAQLLGKKCDVFLCDTYAGVVKSGPMDTYIDGTHNDTSPAIVAELLAKNHVGNCRILQGIFPEDTGATIDDRHFSLCHIDVDVYESAKSVFEWVWSRMPLGGIVVFDDYGFPNCVGITLLCDELRLEPDRVFIHNINGHAVFVKTSEMPKRLLPHQSIP